MESLESRQLLAAVIQSSDSDGSTNQSSTSIVWGAFSNIDGLKHGVVQGTLQSEETQRFQFSVFANTKIQLGMDVASDSEIDWRDWGIRLYDSNNKLIRMWSDYHASNQWVWHNRDGINNDILTLEITHHASDPTTSDSYRLAILLNDRYVEPQSQRMVQQERWVDAIPWESGQSPRSVSLVDTLYKGSGYKNKLLLGYFNAGETVSVSTRLPFWSPLQPKWGIEAAEDQDQVEWIERTDTNLRFTTSSPGPIFLTSEAISGAGVDSQYVLDVSVDDTVAPDVISIAPIPHKSTPVPFPFEVEFSSGVQVEFNEEILGSSLNPDAFELRWAGADGLMDTEDDVIVDTTVLAVPHSPFVRVNPNNAHGPLINGAYRITVDASSAETPVTDLSANPLSNSFSSNFTVSEVPGNFTLQGSDNSSVENATALTFLPDPNATVWQRALGYGILSESDTWWRFEATVGDQINFRSTANGWEYQFSLSHQDPTTQSRLFRLGDQGILEPVNILSPVNDSGAGSYTLDSSGFDNAIIPEDGTYLIKIDGTENRRGGAYVIDVLLARGADGEHSQPSHGPIANPLSYSVVNDALGVLVAAVLSDREQPDVYSLGIVDSGSSLTVDVSDVPAWTSFQPSVTVLDRHWNPIDDLDPADAVFRTEIDQTDEYFVLVDTPDDSDTSNDFGPSYLAQYQMSVAIVDRSPPMVRQITGIPDQGDTVDQWSPGAIVVSFGESVRLPEGETIDAELRVAGADGVFDTPDDVFYDVYQQWTPDRTAVHLYLAADTLVTGSDRLTLSGNLVDQAGHAIDWSGISDPEIDQWTRQFTVSSFAADQMIETIDNDTVESGTPLAMIADANQTGWMRSQSAHGLIETVDDVDWWTFEAKAGDQIEVWADPIGKNVWLDPVLQLSGQRIDESHYTNPYARSNNLHVFTAPSDGFYSVGIQGNNIWGQQRNQWPVPYKLQVNLNRQHSVIFREESLTDFDESIVAHDDGSIRLTIAGTIGDKESSIRSYSNPNDTAWNRFGCSRDPYFNDDESRSERDTVDLGRLKAGTVVELDASEVPDWSRLKPYVELVHQSNDLIELVDEDPSEEIARVVIPVDGRYVATIGTRVAVINGSRFVLTDPMSWQEARDTAIAMGGDLASIENAEQNQWIVGTLGAGWIGLRHDPPGPRYRWTDGSEGDYFAWDNHRFKKRGEVYAMPNCGWRFSWYASPMLGIVEIPAAPDDPPLAGAGELSQYLLQVSITDPAPFFVSSVAGIPEAGQGTDHPIELFQINLSETVVPSTGTISLREAGDDGQFHTEDDTVYSLNENPMESGAGIAIVIASGPLPPGQYQMTVYDDILGQTGHAFDGDRDAVPGGHYTHPFTVDPSSDWVVAPSVGNDRPEDAIVLPMIEQAPGFGWARSDLGAGAIHSDSNEDWWSFTAEAGDFVEVWVRNTTGEQSIESLELYFDDQRIGHGNQPLNDAPYSMVLPISVENDGNYLVRVSDDHLASGYEI